MKRISILLILITLTLQLLSQDDKFNLNIQPPSPNAANFIRYGEIPVGYSTGVPNIEIPLYTIKCDKLEIPITISYHSSGIKVKDIASPIGLGWVLNGGGLISRTILGEEDGYGHFSSLNNSMAEIDNLTETGRKDALWNMCQTNTLGAESQSDRYNFFYPGNSGVFRYRYLTGVIGNPVSNEPILIPFQPLKIEKYGLSTYHPECKYKISDKNGTEYFYEKWDHEKNGNYWFYNTCHLTKIISSDKKDTIQYNYALQEEYGVSDYPQVYYSGCRSIEQSCKLMSPNGGCQPDFDLSSPRHSSFFVTSLLTSIKTKNTTVEFIYSNDRKDIRKQRLCKITISNLTSKIKEINIDNNTYFGNSVVDNQRLKLNSISINDSNGSPIQKYGFEYNISVELPPYYKFDAYPLRNEDYWGYFNGKQLESSIPGEFLPSNVANYYRGNRNPDSFRMKAYILEKITYPTGGWTEYFFEPNMGQEAYSYNNETVIGGLRIQKILNYSGQNTNPEIKTFKYGGSESGYASHFVRIKANLFTEMIMHYEESWVPFSNCGTQGLYFNDYQNWYGESFLPLTLNNASTVFYNEVTEYLGDVNSNIGKVVYTYLNPADDSGLDDTLPFSDARYKNSFQWDRGFFHPQLVSKETFKLGSSTPSEAISYEYSSFNDNIIHMGVNVIKTSTYFDYDDGIFHDSPTYNASYVYTDTKAFTEIKLPSKETRIIDGVTTITDYHFDNTSHLLPTRQVTTCSQTNSTIEKQTRYPSDINSGIYAQMASKNMLNYPIVETSIKDNKIIGSKLISYKAHGYSYVLDSILSLETTTPLSSITTFNGNANTIDSHYGKAEIKFVDYDTKGNILQVKAKNGIVTAYLWDATKTYLMAMVEGATYSQISPQNGQISSYNSKTLWTSLSNLVPNAMIQTFSYKPLVGMSSATAPTGTTTYYLYDTFGRLSEVKDDDGKLLKRNKYRYATN